MVRRTFRPGDWVVYHKTKFSKQPGPRAKQVTPTDSGDEYSYIVDKFWVVSEVRPDGTVLVATRRGKQNVLRSDDEHLRPAKWWERWWFKDRFLFPETPSQCSMFELEIPQSSPHHG